MAILTGCLPPQADFDFGVSTSQVTGEIVLDRPDAIGSEAFIVVQRHHYKFVEVAPERTLTHPTIQVVTPGADGRFRIDVPTDVVSVDMMFIAADHLTRTFRFQRTLGVGRIIYHARLPYMPNWEGHFYTFLLPQLEAYIVEPRYDLPSYQQQRLSDWLQAQQSRLNARRGQREETPRPASDQGGAAPAPSD